MVTVAPGTAAPDGSTTDPPSVPALPRDWENAAFEAASEHQRTKLHVERNRNCMKTPLFWLTAKLKPQLRNAWSGTLPFAIRPRREERVRKKTKPELRRAGRRSPRMPAKPRRIWARRRR